jgi:glycosyltransferase involved in cell wall biosynthesis
VIPLDLKEPDNAPIVSLVIPTRSEALNVGPLLRRLATAFNDFPAVLEVVFVDDSDDDTPAVIAAERVLNPAIRLLHRGPGQRPGGLGGAVQAGFELAQGQTLVVMDADLQHPPEVVPLLVRPILSGVAQLTVGTRFQPGGNSEGLDGRWRERVSKGCRMLAHGLIPRSRSVTDPLSGLFALDRSVIDGVDLQADGFKILLEVIAKGQWLCCVNQPYLFAERNAGTSKAALREGLRFGRHLSRLMRAPRVPDTELVAFAPPAATPSVVATEAPSIPRSTSRRASTLSTPRIGA